MANRISCICIDAVDPVPVAEFWKAVLGFEVREEDDEGISLSPPEGGLPTLDILRVPEPKTVKNRLHLDLRADDTTTDAELEGCSPSAPNRWTSARAQTSIGSSWPTRTATSSASCAAPFKRFWAKRGGIWVPERPIPVVAATVARPGCANMGGMSDLLDDLDDEQRVAVLAVRGPVCIIAGAGTGKTRTVTYRLAYGITSKEVDPRQGVGRDPLQEGGRGVR